MNEIEALRWQLERYRNLGSHLKHIHEQLGDVGWIYYQDAVNASLQYPFIDQRRAIPFDFDWTTCHPSLSATPQNNPQIRINFRGEDDDRSR
jgi:hypothetical protein